MSSLLGAPATPATRDFTIYLGGQSIASTSFGSLDGWSALAGALQDAGVATYPEKVGHARDGAAMLAKSQYLTDYYYDGPSDTEGANLTQSRAAMESLTRDPDAGGWAQGHADSTKLESAADRDAFRDSTIECLNRIASVRYPGAPEAMPWFIMLLGRREHDIATADRINWVREAQLAVIDAMPNAYFGGEFYDADLLPPPDGVHPTEAGSATLGARLGDAIAAHFAPGHSATLGPSVATTTRNGAQVEVTFAVEAGQSLHKPAAPAHFGLYAPDGVRLE
ncbi:MAG: hypothetical protein AAGF32_02675, partial [Pseudomonadota bacterium]